MSVAAILLTIVQLLVPALATYLAVQVAKLNTSINALPGIVKQIIVVLVGAAFTKLSVLFGVQFPPDFAGLADPTVLGGVLSGILAFLIHKLFAPKTA